ncbi:MAG: competence/damage-inducible protein A [Verrucomicrobiia bacterium]
MRIELINTGSELLLGFTVNTHLNYIARKLGEIGLRLERQTTIGDDRSEMRAAITEALRRCDVLIITGGLGPTSDDFTRAVVAELLGRKLIRDGAIATHIAERLRKRGIHLPESIYVQALVPKGAKVLPNHNGTAPGLAVEHNSKLVVLLPGPTRELKPMFEEFVLPMLRQRCGVTAKFDCRTFKVVGLPESAVEEKVAPALADMRDVELGYCARPGEVEVRIISNLKSSADSAEKQIRAALGDHLFGTGEEQLEEVVVRELIKTRKTIVTAESCTGGMIANRITNVSGSSEVFLNGWVTYSNDAKMKQLGVRAESLKQFGAVSEEVACEMAKNARARSGADYAVSATGIAGPTGGTPGKPVGLVFIGMATPQRTVVQRHTLVFDRETFKFFVSQYALDMVRRELLAAKLG